MARHSSIYLLLAATLVNFAWIPVEGFSSSSVTNQGRSFVKAVSNRETSDHSNVLQKNERKNKRLRIHRVTPLFSNIEEILDLRRSPRMNPLSRLIVQLQVLLKSVRERRYSAGLECGRLWKKWSRRVITLFFVVAFQWSMLTSGTQATTQSSMGMLGKTADLPSLSLGDPSTSVPMPKSNHIYSNHAVKSKFSRSTKVITGSGMILLAAVGGGLLSNRRGSSFAEEEEEEYGQQNTALSLRSTDSYLSSSDSANVRSGFDQIRKREKEEGDKIEEARAILQSVEETFNKTSDAVFQTSGVDPQIDEKIGPAILSKLQGEEPAAAKISRRAEKERNEKARKMVQDMLERVEEAEARAKIIKEEQSSFYQELNAIKNRVDDTSNILLPPPLEETPFISWLNATGEDESDAKETSEVEEAAPGLNETTEPSILEASTAQSESIVEDVTSSGIADDAVMGTKITGMQQYLPITPPTVNHPKKATNDSSVDSATVSEVMNKTSIDPALESKNDQIADRLSAVATTDLPESTPLDLASPLSEDPHISDLPKEKENVESVNSEAGIDASQQTKGMEENINDVSVEAVDAKTERTNDMLQDSTVDTTALPVQQPKEEFSDQGKKDQSKDVVQSKPTGFKAQKGKVEAFANQGKDKRAEGTSEFKGAPAIDSSGSGASQGNSNTLDSDSIVLENESSAINGSQGPTEEESSPVAKGSTDSFKDDIGYKNESDEALRKKYASIDNTGERAYQILEDLGMINQEEEGIDDIMDSQD